MRHGLCANSIQQGFGRLKDHLKCHMPSITSEERSRPWPEQVSLHSEARCQKLEFLLSTGGTRLEAAFKTGNDWSRPSSISRKPRPRGASCAPFRLPGHRLNGTPVLIGRLVESLVSRTSGLHRPCGPSCHSVEKKRKRGVHHLVGRINLLDGLIK